MKNSMWLVFTIVLVLIGSVVRKEPLNKEGFNIAIAVLCSAYFICKAIEKQKE